MLIREVTAAEIVSFKDFFMQGLLDRPDCFRISPSDLRACPFPTDGTADSFTIGAFDDEGEWMGTASFKREGIGRERLRHQGLLFFMYVSGKTEGRGIGGRLVDEVLKRVREQTDIEQVVLTLVGTNARAKKLYLSKGFEPYGYQKRAIKWDEQYLDEEFMNFFIDRS
jgi:RimJ/RimL family protein N-acetyltransferase